MACSVIDEKKVCREQINYKESIMTKQTKAAASMSELSDADKRLTAKLSATLKDEKLEPESRNSINRAINKARRGPNAASPEEKMKYVNGYTTFYKQRYSILKKENKLIGVTDAGKVLGAEWRALGEEEKQKFKDQAADDRGSA